MNVLTNTLHKAIHAGRCEALKKVAAQRASHLREPAKATAATPIASGCDGPWRDPFTGTSGGGDGKTGVGAGRVQAVCDVAQGRVLLALPVAQRQDCCAMRLSSTNCPKVSTASRASSCC